MALIRWGAIDPPRPFTPNATVHPAAVALVAAVPVPEVSAFDVTSQSTVLTMVLV